MQFNYSFRLPVPVEQAWPILLDLHRVAPCMPGAAIEAGEGSDYVGRMKVKLGPIEMAYRGELHILEREDSAHLLRIEGIGKEVRGGGGARAMVTMQARGEGGACEIAIRSDYALSGKAAQFGTGMIEEIAGKLMQEFVRRLERLILGDGPAAAPPPMERTAAAPAPVAAAPAPRPASNDNDALDLVGLAWGPVLSRTLPLVHLLISSATLLYVIVK